MGKMKELYTTLQELQIDPRPLEFDELRATVDRANKLDAEKPATDGPE